MNKNLKKILKSLASVLILTFLYFFIKEDLHLFKNLLNLKFYQLLILSLATLLNLLLNCYLFYIFLKYFNLDIKFSKWLNIYNINRLSNLIFIKTGPLIKGAYLKKNHNLPYSGYIYIAYYLTILQLLCFSLIMIASLSLNYFFGNKIFNSYVFAVFLCALLPIGLLLVYSSKIFTVLKRFIKFSFLEKINNFIIETQMPKAVLLRCFAIIFLIVIFYSLKIYFLYFIFFKPISFFSSVLIATIGLLSLFVSITPASLGIREALMSYSAKLIGENFQETIVIATADRLINMAWIVIIGVYIFYFTKKQKNNKV